MHHFVLLLLFGLPAAVRHQVLNPVLHLASPVSSLLSVQGECEEEGNSCGNGMIEASKFRTKDGRAELTQLAVLGLWIGKLIENLGKGEKYILAFSVCLPPLLLWFVALARKSRCFAAQKQHKGLCCESPRCLAARKYKLAPNRGAGGSHQSTAKPDNLSAHLSKLLPFPHAAKETVINREEREFGGAERVLLASCPS